MNNIFRTFLLMALLTVLFVWIGGELGGRNGALIAFLLAAGMNLFAYWFSDKMVLKRYRAREVTPDADPRLYKIVADLARRAHLPTTKGLCDPGSNTKRFCNRSQSKKCCRGCNIRHFVATR